MAAMGTAVMVTAAMTALTIHFHWANNCTHDTYGTCGTYTVLSAQVTVLQQYVHYVML